MPRRPGHGAAMHQVCSITRRRRIRMRGVGGGGCSVQARFAKSRSRLRAGLRSPGLGCESLRGSAVSVAKNPRCDGAVVCDDSAGLDRGCTRRWRGSPLMAVRTGSRWLTRGRSRSRTDWRAAFPSRKGQRHLSGLWWSATKGRHVGFESCLERDHVMLLDFDATIVGIASQPPWLRWQDEAGATPVERRPAKDAAKFDATPSRAPRWVGSAGWSPRLTQPYWRTCDGRRRGRPHG